MISAMPPFFPGWLILTYTSTIPGGQSGKAFSTATRAAAAGGYTLLVDMPLNCLPATTTVAALEAKRAAARNNCWVDWAAWGGVVRESGGHRGACRRGSAGIQVLSDSSRESMASPWLDEDDLRAPCRTSRGPACRCWCMQNLPRRLTRPRSVWPTPTGDLTRRIAITARRSRTVCDPHDVVPMPGI